MKQKTLTAEVITLYRVYERDEWGQENDYFFRTEKEARAKYSSIVDTYKNEEGYFRFEGELHVGGYDDYYEAVREAEKSDESPVGCGETAIPPWDELAKSGCGFVCQRLVSDIELYWNKVTAVKMADGTINLLTRISITKLPEEAVETTGGKKYEFTGETKEVDGHNEASGCADVNGKAADDEPEETAEAETEDTLKHRMSVLESRVDKLADEMKATVKDIKAIKQKLNM